ncbi:MAG: hypothetical protein OXT06_14615 [Rhodospirillaceae bacterium]|nr:hypothetical protein [Rhodospirillaceae bacterium]
MGGIVKAIFSGPPKPKGPDPSLLKAQQDQEARIAKREEEQAKKDRSTRAVIAARSGRGQGVTLNASTGETGISDKLGGS